MSGVNLRRAFIRRGWLPVLALGLLVGGASSDDDDRFRSERQIVRHLTLKVAQYGSGLKETSENERLTSLSSSLSRLKSLLDQMTAAESDVRSSDGRIYNFKVTDLDPKSRVEDTVRRDYDPHLKQLNENAAAFYAANNKAFPDGSAEHLAARDRYASMNKEIQRVEAEKDQKILLAIQVYAAAQREYAAMLGRRDELQTGLDQLSAEFQSVRASAVTQLHSIESGVYDLRRAAGSTTPIESAGNDVARRKLGSQVFDNRESSPPVDLPDVPAPDGTPGPLIMPAAPGMLPNAPQEIVNNPRVEALRLEGVALQEKGRLLEAEKATLFSTKDATPGAWTAYANRVQEHSVKVAQHVIDERSLGGSKLLDMDAMDVKPHPEPSSSAQESKP